MQNIRFLVGLLLIHVTVHGMQQIEIYTPSPWHNLSVDIKTGIVSRSEIIDKKNLRLVNKDLALLASKANFPQMINHFPCIFDRPHHLEFMINYSLQRDESAQNIMACLIKNSHLCDHEDALDIVSHFYPPINDKECFINALENGDCSSIKKDLCNIIPILTQIYKKDQNNKSLQKLIVPEIMNIYGGYEIAIDEYKKNYKQEEKTTTHLHIAVENEHAKVAELFVTQNPNLLYMTDTNGMIPLSIAAQKGNAEIIKIFQKFSKHKNKQNIDIPFDKSPYFFAMQTGNEECLQLLLAQDDCTNSDASMSLQGSVALGNLQIVKMLLELPNVDVNFKNFCGVTAVHIAVLAHPNNIPLLQLLLTKGALLNEKDVSGNSPLMLAVQTQSLEITKLLIQQPNIDINAYIEPNLELLQKHSSIEALNMNEENITQIKMSKGLSTLCYAAHIGNVEMVQLLLDNDAALYNSYQTPLMIAAHYGYYEIVKKIVNHSPHCINNVNDKGITALFPAINEKKRDIVEFLLSHGAQVNLHSKEPEGWSPLLHAIQIGDLDIVQLLVQKGADINYEMIPDMSVLGFATYTKNQPIIDFLRSQTNIIIK